MKEQFFEPFGFLLFVGLVLIPAAELNGHVGSHEFSLPIEQIEHAEAIEAIRLYGRLSAYHPEATEHFREALLLRGDMEAFVKKRLDELPQTALNGEQRNFYFRLLSSLRTPWAARICGQYLLSNVSVEIPEFKTEEEARSFFMEAGNTGIGNSGYAMYALEQMNIDTAPCEFGGLTPPGKETRIELWQKWWRSNEANIDDLLAGKVTPSPSGKDDPMRVGGDSTDLQQTDSGTPEVQTARHHRDNGVETKVDPYRWRLILVLALCVVPMAVWLIIRARQA